MIDLCSVDTRRNSVLSGDWDPIIPSLTPYVSLSQPIFSLSDKPSSAQTAVASLCFKCTPVLYPMSPIIDNYTWSTIRSHPWRLISLVRLLGCDCLVRIEKCVTVLLLNKLETQRSIILSFVVKGTWQSQPLRRSRFRRSGLVVTARNHRIFSQQSRSDFSVNIYSTDAQPKPFRFHTNGVKSLKSFCGRAPSDQFTWITPRDTSPGLKISAPDVTPQSGDMPQDSSSHAKIVTT